MYQVKKNVGRPRNIYNCKDCKNVIDYELNKTGVFKCTRCIRCYVKHIDNLELIEAVNKICEDIDKKTKLI